MSIKKKYNKANSPNTGLSVLSRKVGELPRLRLNLKKDEMNTLEKIARWFILPLVAHCPKEMSQGRFLEQLFHLDTRLIDKYVVHRAFDLDVLKRQFSSRYIRGLPDIKLKVGEIVFLRYDTTKPDVIELSAFKGRGGEERIYLLDMATYNKMALFIEKVALNEY